jgi:hypothetical protein
MKKNYLTPAVRCKMTDLERKFLASALADFDENVIYDEEEQP